MNPVELVQSALQASTALVQAGSTARTQGLQLMAQLLRQQRNAILEANTLDLETSREMEVPLLLLDWLKLTPERLETVIQVLQALAETPDPVGAAVPGMPDAIWSPLGTIALLYESLPGLGVMAAGMGVRSGNALFLKGGSEASQTNAVLFDLWQQALTQANLPAQGLINLSPESGSVLKDLLALTYGLNLVIPYGRPSWVDQMVRQTTVPVLRSAIGNVYLYWGMGASMELVRDLILDSHRSELDPVNAIEKVLIAPTQSDTNLLRLWESLQEKDFELRGDAELGVTFPTLQPVDPVEWSKSYLRKAVAFRRVVDLNEAIALMNRCSSGHANAIATDSYTESQR
ncbi:MAG: gamma-glutamyl-phosphate reductase, partial [Synechococcales bacterium]|nr:gamma-glutamyl-phosphate reductase [Synechococcales bacterium]